MVLPSFFRLSTPVSIVKSSHTQLLRFHANPNLCDVDGWTPLHCAARAGRISTCWLLLQTGAVPAMKDHSEKQRTASMVAATFKRDDLSRILRNIEEKVQRERE
jgi:ankyrin repeat protein